MWANFQRIIELFTQKIVTKLSKIWIWNPGSGKTLFRIPAPGVKKAPDPGSGSATLVFGPPGFGSVRQSYGSGSFHHQAKIVRKTWISTVDFCLFMTFYL